MRNKYAPWQAQPSVPSLCYVAHVHSICCTVRGTKSSVATLLFSTTPGVQIFDMIVVIVLIVLSVTSKQIYRGSIFKH
jgi:hypothetical protein